MEDWGVATDILCYHKYDKEYQKIHVKIHWLQLDATTVEQDYALYEQHLKASRCTEGLTHLEGLGPKSAHAKWDTCFTNDKDEDKRPSVRLNHCG
jgi:hypothetical protein